MVDIVQDGFAACWVWVRVEEEKLRTEAEGSSGKVFIWMAGKGKEKGEDKRGLRGEWRKQLYSRKAEETRCAFGRIIEKDIFGHDKE